MPSVTLSAHGACLGFLLFAMASASPPAPAQVLTDGGSIAALESRKASVEGDTTLAEDVKARILELFTSAVNE